MKNQLFVWFIGWIGIACQIGRIKSIPADDLDSGMTEFPCGDFSQLEDLIELEWEIPKEVDHARRRALNAFLFKWWYNKGYVDIELVSETPE